MRDTTEAEIVGRAAEITYVAGWLDALTEASSLLLEGEAGIGKTTVWREGLELARTRGLRVLACSCVAAEASLSFSNLTDLMEPALDEALAALPEPQRHAMQVALLREEPGYSRVDQRTIAAGTLSTLGVLAARKPLLLAIDDAQWLDGPSAGALAFAFRRLTREPVGLLLSVRSDSEPNELISTASRRGSRLGLGPFDPSSLGRVIALRLGIELPPRVLGKVREASQGNPFMALELARGFADTDLPDEPGAPFPVANDLKMALTSRLSPLPDRTRAVLLHASTLARPTMERLELAVGTDAQGALAPAVHGEIVRIHGDRVSFTHPLLASAVWSDASEGDRREAHARHARSSSDPEERARHEALAAEGPDEAVADALDEAAKHAHARGASASAAELSELAVARTPIALPEKRHSRILQAAENHLVSGDEGRALELLESLTASAPSGLGRAEAMFRLGRLLFRRRSPHTVALLEDAAKEGAADPALASRVHGLLAWSLTYSGDLGRAELHARKAVRLAERTDDDAATAESLRMLGWVGSCFGRGVLHETFHKAVDLESSIDPLVIEDMPSFIYAGALSQAGMFADAIAYLSSALEAATARGDEGSIRSIRYSLGRIEWARGDPRAAIAHLEEALMREQARPRTGHAFAGYVLACLGEIDRAAELAGRALETARSEDDVFLLIRALGAVGFLELSDGEQATAHSRLREAWQRFTSSGFGEPMMFPFPPDAIEASIAVGDHGTAGEIVAFLEERGRALSRPQALAVASRGKALLLAAAGDHEGASFAIHVALDQHRDLSVPFDLARTMLAAGTILRRAKRKKPARDALEEASVLFERTPAPLWASKARSELDRVSGRKPVHGALTSTEERVARLAAAGRSNKEIADMLFVSVRTVEGHLSHVYHKLGLRSRVDLAVHLTLDAQA
jgi:DNA-binding CsgD family transcriptional regulator